MKVARELVQGVDLWLNTPAARRRSLRHQRHEGRHERRAESLASSTAGSTRLMRSRAAGPSATARITRKIRTRSTPAISTICWRTKSCRCSMRNSEGGGSGEWVKRMKTSMMNLTPRFRCAPHGSRLCYAALQSRA